MNIILLSGRLSTAITLNLRQLRGLVLLLLLLVGMLVAATAYLSHTLTRKSIQLISDNSGNTVANRQQIDLIAVKVGQMQAQLLRLDGLTRDVADKTGIDIGVFQSNVEAPQGGAPSTLPERPISSLELLQTMAQTQQKIDEALAHYTTISTLLAQRKFHHWQAPTHLPISSGVLSSAFGWRIDPFTGNHSFHEGVDFIGQVGEPIVAAAHGRVVIAGHHPQYGNMVEINHGNHISSRYAHAAKLFVKVGDNVKTGDRIASVGNTGRSTGAHLHFEIRYKEVPQNPLYFVGFVPSNRRLAIAMD